ncbi:hypothetical protein SASPL_104949 [Salvia splendens]|uniref:Tyrosine-protein kinase catalytic domain-containing protein n=1 Tax=Salvia splendens TaxID=180675 RepID=A0A8X8YK80_SALSN|nr:hypothetical protein SASPL_104949 [Salvia splendens]
MLAKAVIKREEIWQLCHQNSISTIASDTPRSSYSTEDILRLYGIAAMGNASGSSTRKLFPAWLWKRKPNQGRVTYFSSTVDEEDHFGLQSFSLRELRVATDSFSDKNILVRGGRDMEMISIPIHCNVIRARGFCITQKEKLLVYPYMANGSVAFWLRVLADLSVGEFVDCCGNDLVTPVKGTIGHIAPEYLAIGKCSVKNDVFGYGVFLLELITAQKALDLARLAIDGDTMLIKLVSHIYIEKECEVIVDAELQREFIDEEVEELLQIALICTREEPEGRPTMFEVVRRLEVAYHLTKEEWSSMEDFKEDILEGRDVENFSMDKLHAATKGFSNKIISEDSFNVIYKGCLDDYPVALPSTLPVVKQNYEERRWESMADIEGGDDEMEAVTKQLVKIAALCTRYDPNRRPRMSDVVMML